MAANSKYEYVLQSALKSVSVASAKQSPVNISNIVSDIQLCRPLIVGSESGATSALVHKLNTQIITLSKSKKSGSNQIAIALVKTLVEFRDWGILGRCSSWVRELLHILQRSFHQRVKTLAIITLTRIFQLLTKYPTLVREIAVPNLPTFVNICLNQAGKRTGDSAKEFRPNKSCGILHVIFESFVTLLPNYSATLRPFLTQLESLVSSCIIGNKASKHLETSDAARRLYASLHQCAPKNTNAEHWNQSIKSLIQQSHTTSSVVFRCVKESWRPLEKLDLPTIPPETFQLPASELMVGSFNGKSWTGIDEGINCLVNLLHVLRRHVEVENFLTVVFPIGAIVNLLERHWGLKRPSEPLNKIDNFNLEISRDERELLFARLPQIDAAGLEILTSLFKRLGNVVAPIIPCIVEMVAKLFDIEYESSEIRIAAYTLFREMLLLGGNGLPKHCIQAMANLIERCSEDCLPRDVSTTAEMTPSLTNGASKPNGTSNVDSFSGDLPTQNDVLISAETEVAKAASRLLPVLLSQIDLSEMHSSVRSLLDQVAILSNNKSAMLASVLNHNSAATEGGPPCSILPHLARAYGGDAEVEALVRPRLPAIVSSAGDATNLRDEIDYVADKKYDYEPEDLARMNWKPLFPQSKSQFEDLLVLKNTFGGNDMNPRNIEGLDESRKRRSASDDQHPTDESQTRPPKHMRLENNEGENNEPEDVSSFLADFRESRRIAEQRAAEAKAQAAENGSDNGSEESDFEFGPALTKFMEQLPDGEPNESDEEAQEEKEDSEGEAEAENSDRVE